MNEQREELEQQIEQKETRRSELELACRQSNVFQEEERLLNMEKALRDEQKKLEQGLQNLEVEIKREARRLQRFCGEIQELEPEELLIPVQEAANTAQKAYAVFTGDEKGLFAGLWSCLKRGSRQRPNCRMLSAVRLIKQRIVLQS